MQRRHFVTLSAVGLAGCTLGAASPRTTPASTAARFHAARRVVTTRFGAISCADRGTGDAALFLHGYPLNAFQWRGAIERLSPYRRCIAPDLMGLGYTQTHADQDLSPQAQTDMIVALLTVLGIQSVDVVANDSGGTIAQLFAGQNPARIRTLLLTNCDVHENSPPAALRPFIETARAGRAADEFLAPQLADKDHARSPQGMGGLAYTDPANLTDECIQYYFEPLLSSAVRKAQFKPGYGSEGKGTVDGHAALDWGSLRNRVTGIPVRAAAPGIVAFAGEDFTSHGACRMVTLAHPDTGHKTGYVHLDTILVSDAQRVLRGHILGTLGKSCTDWPHLHFTFDPGWKPGVYDGANRDPFRDTLDVASITLWTRDNEPVCGDW